MTPPPENAIEVQPSRRPELDPVTYELLTLLQRKAQELRELDGSIRDAQQEVELRDLLLQLRQQDQAWVGRLEAQLAPRLRPYHYGPEMRCEPW